MKKIYLRYTSEHHQNARDFQSDRSVTVRWENYASSDDEKPGKNNLNIKSKITYMQKITL